MPIGLAMTEICRASTQSKNKLNRQSDPTVNIAIGHILLDRQLLEMEQMNGALFKSALLVRDKQ
jgi:hypothetical protein